MLCGPVRAAVGMQQVLRSLNEELKVRFGVTLANRTGVNTGEVVATDDPARDQKLATGDAVNVTARLEAAAPAGEIYIGEVTYRLVRDAVQAEPVEPLALKGKSQPVPAFRLIAVHGEMGNVRRLDTPLVGRDAELALLDSAWQEALNKRRARLVTLMGDAGVGKTRLVRDFMDRLASRARIISGRCLPYGEGITFWPLRGMIVAAAGIRDDDTPEEARARIAACVHDPQVADRLASAAGLGTTPYPLHEINWGARKFLQGLAAESPVVALFDDIHWAEPAFLDMLESLVETIEDAPVLLLATARHDLLESHPEWGERDGARRIVLQPLGDTAVAEVVHNLLGGAGLPDLLIEGVIRAAEGNPLYVEQMLSMLIDSGAVRQEEGRWVAARSAGEIAVPPTIHALLEARLDKLDRGERAAAEPASVIGLEFARPAVQSLSPLPLRDSIDEKLKSLSRKHFIRPAISTEGEPHYRFDHHLVRDTVYNGLLKRARAAMHAEFVKWADEVNAGSDRGREFEEILGYHLEQAYKYLGELGPIDDAGVAIGRDAARRLSSAGRRAFARGDMHAAANLFGRVSLLLEEDDLERLDVLPELGEASLELGDFERARIVLDEAVDRADKLGNVRLRASAQLLRMRVRLFSAEPGDFGDETLRLAGIAIPLLEKDVAHRDLARAWRLIGFVHGNAGRYGKSSQAINNSTTHARLAGDERLIARNAMGLSVSALLGPTPVDEAISDCQQMIDRGLVDRLAKGKILCTLAQLRAMKGDFLPARVLYRQGRELLSDLGQAVIAASTGTDLLAIELLAGDLRAAETEALSDYKFLEELGETYLLSTMSAMLARVVRDQGRDDEALELTRKAEQASAPEDVDSQALWRSVRAPILARKGSLTEAEAMAQSAVRLSEQTDALTLQADTLFELAEVLRLSGKRLDANNAMGRARALFEAKGDRVSAEKSATWLAD